MKLKRGIIYLIVCLIALCVSSCNTNVSKTSSSTETTPDIGITTKGAEYLQISIPTGWNTFKTADPISLMLINVSNNQIVSREDFHCRIFVFDQGKWIEVNNKIVYAGNQIVLEPNKEIDPAKITGLIIQPDLADLSKPYQVRVFLFGSMANADKTQQEIIDNIDVMLSP